VKPHAGISATRLQEHPATKETNAGLPVVPFSYILITNATLQENLKYCKKSPQNGFYLYVVYTLTDSLRINGSGMKRATICVLG